MRQQLTAAMVDKLAAPAAGRVEIFDTIVPALALRVTPNGAKSYVVRGRVKGQATPIRLTIGDARYLKLADARQLASHKLRLMLAGSDPREAIREERAERALTLGALIDEWEKLYLSQRRQKYREDAVSAIRRAMPGLLTKSAATITKADAVNAIDRIALAGHHVAARNTLAYARACFGWARQRGKVPVNPFADLPIATVKSERERVLTDDEVRAVWAATDRLSYPFGPWFKLAILTLQRRNEVAAMGWSEIDLDKHLWTIPGGRMKNGRPHDVHLSEAAVAVLGNLPRIGDSDLVFTTGRRRDGGTEPAPVSGFSQAKRYLDAAITETRGASIAPWHVHDLRRTGVTTLAGLGFDSIVVDKLLAHQPGKLRGVAAVYQRHDFARERASALDAWSAHVIGLDADNVVSLPARGAL